MAASIGKTSLILGAQWSALSKGLDKAYGQCQSFKSRVSSLFGSTTAKVAGVAGFAGGLVGAATAGEGLAKVLATIDEKAKLGAAATAFGLTAQQFTGVAAVAKSVGGDSRELIESLVTLGKVAADGAAGKGEVAAQFFADLNLNAREFVSLRADQQFFKVFEALERVKDPLAKVRTLMVAFGEDGGKNLLPLLGKTSAELRTMAAELSTTAGAMADMQRAQAAVVKATAAMEAAWGKVAVAVAPVVEAIANQIPGAIDRLIPKIEQLKAVGSVGDSTPGRWARVAAGTADFGRNVVGTTGVGIGFGVQGLGGLLKSIGGGYGNHMTGAGPSDNALTRFADGLMATGRGGVANSRGMLGTPVQDALRKEFDAIDKRRKDPALTRAAAAVPQKPKAPFYTDADYAYMDGIFASVEAEWKAKKNAERKAANAKVKDDDKDDAPAKLERAASLLAGAMEKGSRDEYSTRVRFQTGQLNVVEKQVAEQRKTTDAVKGVTVAVNKLAAKPPAAPLRVI